MKNLILALILIAGPNVFASSGGEGVGGGDLCEKRIQDIRDDIREWIAKGGPQNNKLQLPSGISIDKYRQAMSKYLAITKQQDGSVQEATDIECTHQPPEVQGYEKVCRFDNQSSPKITCYYEGFLDQKTMSDEKQYQLIHHEFAGLAGVEVPNGPQSTYSISDQISAYLQTLVIKKLAIMPLVFNPPIAAPNGFTFSGAASAFAAATIPTMQDTQGHWLRIGIAEIEPAAGTDILGMDPGYSTNGEFPGTEKVPYPAILTVTFGQSADVLGTQSSPSAQFHLTSKDKTEALDQGPFIVTYDKDGASFSQYLSDNSNSRHGTIIHDDAIYFSHNCRLLQKDKLICAMTLNGDPSSPRLNDEERPYLGKLDVYELFKRL